MIKMSNLGIKDYKSLLVIDHEKLSELDLPNFKKKVTTLKEARQALLLDEYNAIVFLSVLEEANDIETFLNGVRQHPKLSTLPVFCEYGLMLALPKNLGLIGFEETSLEEEEEDDEDVFNEEISFDLSEGQPNKSEPKQKLSTETIEFFFEDFKDRTAKALVLLEKDNDSYSSKDEMKEVYLSILRRELSE